MKTTILLAIGIALAAVTPSSQAALQVVNGDFTSGITDVNQGDVADPWYDANPANFWEAAWHINHDQPLMSDGYTPLVIFSASELGGVYLYQNIGVRSEAEVALPLSFELGSFRDTADIRSGALTISIFQSDSFVGANDVDVATSGATLIDSAVVTTGDLNPGDSVLRSATLNLASANLTDPLFLHFDMAGEWIGMDNVQIVPEPSTFAIVGLGLAVLAVRRRRL